MLKEMRFPQVYLVCGYTDMRRSIDGLAGIVKQNFGLEPCSGSLFLFCGKSQQGFLKLFRRSCLISLLSIFLNKGETQYLFPWRMVAFSQES